MYKKTKASLVNKLNISSILRLEYSHADANDLVGGDLALLIVGAGEGVQRGQEADALQRTYGAERMQDVENLVHLGRRERLDAHVFELGEAGLGCGGGVTRAEYDIADELLADDVEGQLAVGDGEAGELGAAVGHDGEQGRVRMAEVVHG